MKTRRFFSAVISILMGVAFLFVGPMSATAVSPLPSLDGLITDQVGLLGDQVSEIEAAQTAFHQATGANFYVVFVDSFGGMTPEDWTTATGRNANLQRQDLILAVAPDVPGYWLQHGGGYTFTAAQTANLEHIMDNSLDAGLEGSTTWQAAVANIIGAFQNEIAAGSAPAAQPGATAEPAAPAAPAEPGTPVAPAEPAPAPGATVDESATSGGWPGWLTALLVVVGIIAAAIAIIYGWGGYKRRRLEARQAENPFNIDMVTTPTETPRRRG